MSYVGCQITYSKMDNQSESQNTTHQIRDQATTAGSDKSHTCTVHALLGTKAYQNSIMLKKMYILYINVKLNSFERVFFWWTS